jgi:hypothetical protein
MKQHDVDVRVEAELGSAIASQGHHRERTLGVKTGHQLLNGAVEGGAQGRADLMATVACSSFSKILP